MFVSGVSETLTTHVSVFPFDAFATTYVVPICTGVIVPFGAIVTISVFPLNHVIVLFEAFVGNTVAVSDFVSFEYIEMVLSLTVTLSTKIILSSTCTIHSTYLPFDVVARITVSPSACAVIVPELSTDAMSEFAELH